MKTLVLATKNNGKIAELKQLLKPLEIELITALDIDLPEVEETGKTFAENAALKSESIASFTGLPALADDSGLCVDALNGAPGVYSARYGGYDKLLKEMEKIEGDERSARFECVLALTIPGNATQFFDGHVEGMISIGPQGAGGFGYDPVFQPENELRTYAEMTSEEKAKTSHRGRALARFKAYMEKNFAV